MKKKSATKKNVTPLWMAGICVVVISVTYGYANDPNSGEFEVLDCTVQLTGEIEVPALSPGRLTTVDIKTYQQIEAGSGLAKLDEKMLQDRLKVASVRRQLLTNQWDSETQQKIATTGYRDAKLQYESNLNMQASSMASISALEVNRSQVALQRAELELKRVAEQKDELRLEMNIQAAEIATIENLIRELTVVSPVTGVVLALEKQAGEWVQTGETVARVAPLDRLLIPVLVSENQLFQRRAAGVSVTVRWRERDVTHALRGKVAGVDPQFRLDNQYRVNIEVENRKVDDGWLLLPGRRVSVTFHPSESEPVSASPATARLLQPPDNYRQPSIR